MGQVFFVGDLPFGHENIMRYDSRPFDTVEDMDRELIRRWNEQVTADDDIVYILGDLSWHKVAATQAILKRLRGKKILIRGNHDKFVKDASTAKMFDEIVPYKEIVIDDTLVVLCHYPIMCWKNRMRNSIHLYAHVHTSEVADVVEDYKQTLINLQQPCRMYNVGCMKKYMKYAPQTLETILQSNNDSIKK